MPTPKAKKKSSPQLFSFELAENIASHIGVGIYVVQNSKFVYISPLYKNLTGYSERDLIGKDCLERVHPDDKKMVREQAIRNLKGESQRSYEYRYIRSDGSIMWILETITSITHNKKRAALGSFMDITEHKKTEEELSVSEKRYRTVLEEIEEGYYELDLKGNYTFVNDAICKALGYSRDEIIGMNFKTILAEEQIEDAYKIWGNVYQKSQVVKYHLLTNICKDGTRIDVVNSIAPLYDKACKIIGFKGVARNITERKQIEEMLTRSEEKYINILEEIQDGYFETDMEGNFTFANRAECEKTGYSKEEFLKLNYRQIQDEKTAKKMREEFIKLYKKGISVQLLNTEIFRKDGVKLFSEVSVSLIRDSAGKPVGFRGISRDVTKRRQMEETIRQSEERYRTIIEEMNEWYLETDLAGNLLFSNDSLARALKYPLQKLSGINYRSFIKKEQADEIFELSHQVYQTLTPIKTHPFKFIWPNGDIAYTEISIFPKLNNENKISGFRMIGREISERMKMDEAIRQSEERYRTIIEEMDEWYLETDLAGNLLFFNDSIERAMKHYEKTLDGANYKFLMRKEQADDIFRLFHQVYQTLEPIKNYPFKFVWPDGEIACTEISIFPKLDSENNIFGFRAVGHEITERLKMDEAIRQSEEKYRSIVNEVDEWYFEIDLDGTVVFINDAVVRSSGYPKERIIGLNYKSFINKDRSNDIIKAFRDVYATAEAVHNFPYELVLPSGTVTFFELSIFPKKDHDGRIIGFRGVGHDITEHKRSEEKLNYIATHDLLTGLPNRMLMMDRLKMAMAQANRNEHKLALMMLDLDNFKVVNDSMGHMVGDELLKKIALRLSGRLRQNDTIARLGGDEFIILLPAIDQAEDAVEVAKIVLESFEQPFVCNEHLISCTISIGIAIYPDDAQDTEVLLKNADAAMYYVKAHGKNCYHLFALTNNNNDHAGQSVQ